jgi:hypothetical protein
MTAWHVHRHPLPERLGADGAGHTLQSLLLTLVVLVLFAGMIGLVVGEGLALVVRLLLGFFDVEGGA